MTMIRVDMAGTADRALLCLTRKISASGFLPDVKFFGATFFTYVGKALGYLTATLETPTDIDNTLVRAFDTEASSEDKVGFYARCSSHAPTKLSLQVSPPTRRRIRVAQHREVVDLADIGIHPRPTSTLQYVNPIQA